LGRVKERLDVAEKALSTLFAALEATTLPATVRRDVCVLRFVYSFEATWKAAQAVLNVQHGVVANTPRSAIRACVTTAILDEATGEAVLRMVDDRNMAAHTYNEDLAERLFERMPAHAAGLRAWLSGLRASMDL